MRKKPTSYKDLYYKMLEERSPGDPPITLVEYTEKKTHRVPVRHKAKDDGDEDNRKWEATESTISFNFSNLIKKVKGHLKKQYPDDSPEELSEKIDLNLKYFTINDQYFEYASYPPKLGGIRWFVLCPKCKKKSLKLYLPKSKDREPLYLCKECHKLKPSSLLLGNRTRYKKIARPLIRLEHIKKKLLKRKLSAKEAETLLEEYTNIEKQLADSPEYRLWKFKKEHGGG